MDTWFRRLRLVSVALVLLASFALAGRAPADLLSEDSDFGADTITRDTETGLGWLDVTLSVNMSYAQVVAELEPGGDFAGYRLAAGNEVSTLFEHAGISCCNGSWLPENYGPITALAALVGQTSSSGSCGAGCTFFETRGWYDSGDPPAFYFAFSLAWFDNSAGLNPSYPQAPIGRALSITSSSDSMSATRGAWLVEAPEAEESASASLVALLLAGLSRRRRQSA